MEFKGESKVIFDSLTNSKEEEIPMSHIIEAIEHNIDICCARIAQSVRHHPDKPIDSEVKEDYVNLLNDMLLLYQIATGKEHYIESLDRTDY